MDEHKEPTVWGVFVGQHGDQLEAFNSRNGPFPPEPGSDGYIAIGWAALGDMRMYRDNYPDYLKKFRIMYPDENERVLKTQANIPWNFAYVMRDGDLVMCPSSATGYLLVGTILGDYDSDFDNWESVAITKTRADLLHLRRVRWQYIVATTDPRYEKLHQIGQLTVVRPNLSAPDLLKLLNGTKHA